MKSWLLLAGMLTGLSAQAADVVIPVSEKLQAVGNYVKGEASKPAILIVHGFLTNNKFHTITAMEDVLQMEGYTTLSPNLTLNINRRTNAISCTSIHTHTLEQDIAELKKWVEWLTAQGHEKVILLGHSSGSQQILELLAREPLAHVKAAVLTSTFHLNGKDLGTSDKDLQQAQNDLAKGYKQPRPYSFLFCLNNYNATAQSFHSYQIITRKRVLDTLKGLNIPSITIMGADDERYLKVGYHWLDELKETGTQLHKVEGANHFFSNNAENKLQDMLVKTIGNLAP